MEKTKKWFYERHLPKYIRFWPTWYWLAIWCAPFRYKGNENLPSRNDTYWEALRVTIRKGGAHSKLLYVIKKGTVY